MNTTKKKKENACIQDQQGISMMKKKNARPTMTTIGILAQPQIGQIPHMKHIEPPATQMIEVKNT
jgi:hypothetical protein